MDASSLFEGLPLSLQADISVSLYKDMIERVNLFLLYICHFFKFVVYSLRENCHLSSFTQMKLKILNLKFEYHDQSKSTFTILDKNRDFIQSKNRL